MPKELHGFYYDEEKNRYFPVKGPIPGSSRKRKPPSSFSSEISEKSASQLDQANKLQKSMTSGNKLLQSRELCGNLIASRTGRLNFQTEYEKKLASQPLIWKYQKTEKKVVNAVEQLSIDVNMPAGATETDILLTGGLNGALCLFQVGKVGQEFEDEVKCTADRVWPSSIGHQPACILPRNLWRPVGVSVHMPSEVSCIKLRHLPVDDASTRDVLITTMGAGASRGVVYILDLNAPLEFSYPVVCHPLASFQNTIWTADSCNRNQVVIGTNQGAFLVGVGTGTSSQILRCKSDVLSLQPDHSGNNILCGLRNGAIVLVDTRQKCQEFSSQHHHVSSRLKLQTSVRGSCKIYMPSSISCLKSLMLSDQYFIASSMDGLMKLYDQRLIQKGAVQSYEGNVNTHSRIQFGIDPSERIIVSGGEDCKLRLWSIKSGEMLFQGNFMSSIPSVVCWPKTGGLPRKWGVLRDNCGYWQNREWGVWLGSREGLFYLDW